MFNPALLPSSLRASRRVCRAHFIQGFVVAVSKGDRRDLIHADLLGVTRSRNYVEDLSSGSEDDYLSDSDSNAGKDDSYKPIGEGSPGPIPSPGGRSESRLAQNDSAESPTTLPATDVSGKFGL